jgi:hypothetical protein
MDNNTVTQLLKDYRSYKFCYMNLKISSDDLRENLLSIPLYNQRKPMFLSNNSKAYDRDRYGRIVTLLESAVDFVLDDEQQSIIKLKYMERNTVNLIDIADALHKDRKTIGTLHKAAINKLAKALLPITEDYMEITNIDHMFDPEWQYHESA